MTYKEAIEFGKEQLTSAEILDAQLDARLLLEFVTKVDRTTLFVHSDQSLLEEEEKSYRKLIEDRASHIPLQQLTKVQNFMGFDFFVNEHVLIPRQDTENLVEEAMQQLHDGMEVLDLCTGSGCILISLLKYSNDCKGVGVDLSTKALEVARVNVERFQLEDSVTLLESDLYDKVEGKFDLIISNPPYIPTEVVKTLMPEVLEHEPWMALDGMEDGLHFYREIIKNAPDYLYRGGKLFFEIGYDQGQSVKQLMEARGFTEVVVKQDYAGLDRVVYGTFIE